MHTTQNRLTKVLSAVKIQLQISGGWGYARTAQCQHWSQLSLHPPPLPKTWNFGSVVLPIKKKKKRKAFPVGNTKPILGFYFLREEEAFLTHADQLTS